MRLETLENKSIVVIGTLTHERETVAAFRQFRIGEIVRYDDDLWQITSMDTVVNDHDSTWHNTYNLVLNDERVQRATVAEMTLLQDNVRKAPDNVIDAIADILPMPAFTHGDWQGGISFMQYLRNVGNNQ